MHALLAIFERTRNVILYGPPGTGKTYLARLAAHAFTEAETSTSMSESELVTWVTFHQSYSYEDFIEGLRPISPDDSAGEVTLDRKNLLKIIPEASSYAPKFNHLGLFEINKEKLYIRVAEEEQGIHWQTDMTIDHLFGPEVTIGFDLSLMEKVLKTMDTDKIIWRYANPHSAVLFLESDQSTDDAVNLLMPIRLSDHQTDEESHENKPDH